MTETVIFIFVFFFRSQLHQFSVVNCSSAGSKANFHDFTGPLSLSLWKQHYNSNRYVICERTCSVHGLQVLNRWTFCWYLVAI